MEMKIRVFILQKEKHISCSVVYLHKDFKIENSDESHLLDHLSKNTDLFFIFSKELTKKISPKKFSTLYNSLGYAISETENDTIAILNAIEYLNEVIKKHLYYFIIGEGLPPIDELNWDEDILKIQQAGLQRAVFSTLRTSYDSLEKIYKVKEQSWWERLLGRNSDEDSGLYCTKSSNDKILFFPALILKTIILNKGEDKYYLDSFRNYYFNTFIASTIDEEYLLNFEIKDILIKDNENEV